MHGLGQHRDHRQMVVIIDSDFNYASWVSNIFIDTGLEVRTVMDTSQAALLFGAQVPDLVIVDYHLPPVGGVAFINSIRQKYSRTPIPVLYSLPNEHITPMLRDQLYALDDFITKPATIPELVERAQHLLSLKRDLPAVVQELGRFATRYHSHGYRRADITVLFADVRGFTAFSETHDPETSAGILNSIFEIMAQAVLRYGGIIDKYIGDEMMAIFGYGTQSNEGHELAAVYAAQDMMQGVMNELAENLLVQGGTLAIGIGIHTGYALVGPIGATFRRDVTAIGGTVNIAARLCSMAGRGEIIISQNMHSITHSALEILDERAVSLKGIRNAQKIFSVQLRKPSIATHIKGATV